MKWGSRDRRFHALSLFFAAVPFAFALIRAIRTGHDLRYFWVALASLVGAAATLAVGSAYSSRTNAVVALSVVVFVVATLLAVGAALLTGTRLGPGSLVVGSAFGFCFAVGVLLDLLARRRDL